MQKKANHAERYRWNTGYEEPALNTCTCSEFLAEHRKILLLNQLEGAGPTTIDLSVIPSKMQQ